jgi:cysteinyl-tRNA synthetase
MITFYNTLSKKKESFEPMHRGKARLAGASAKRAGIYTCGPTVYGKVHIGNIRAYLTADMARRILEHEGFEVRHIKNITDVGHLTEDDVAQGDSGEDKIEKKARAEKKTPEEIARYYEAYFRETEQKMNILPAHFFPRATLHVPQMITLIKTLIKKNHAYEKNGNVFLDVTSFKNYGRLSGNTLDKLKIGARLEEHPDKRHPWDFALWLKAPATHLMRWTSPWSKGYPGWHIECSAMSMEYLGEQFDIHTGGEDNIFPHHEAEIAQSECATGHTPFARYWIHSRHLLVDGEKMSKSKGNFYTLEDIEIKGFTAMDLRLTILSSHYRSQMNFTWDGIEQARANRKTLESFRDRLINLPKEHHHPRGGGEPGSTQPAIGANRDDAEAFSAKASLYQKEFLAALEDDLNTPEAITILLAFVREGNKAIDAGILENPEEIKKMFLECTNLLGLVFKEKDAIPEAIRHLASARHKAREEKNFPEADRLRGEIESAGYLVEDTPRGFTLKKS